MDILPAQHNKRRKKAENIGRLRAIDFTFHDKNLYAINNVRFSLRYPKITIYMHRVLTIPVTAEWRSQFCTQSRPISGIRSLGFAP